MENFYSQIFSFRLAPTLVKWSPSLITGVVGKARWGLINRKAFFNTYKLLITKNRSCVFFTGKNLLLGTFIPKAPLKHFMAAPAAVSNWITFTLSSVVFGLTITSKSRQSSSRVRLMAANENANALTETRSERRFEHSSYGSRYELGRGKGEHRTILSQRPHDNYTCAEKLAHYWE